MNSISKIKEVNAILSLDENSDLNNSIEDTRTEIERLHIEVQKINQISKRSAYEMKEIVDSFPVCALFMPQCSEDRFEDENQMEIDDSPQMHDSNEILGSNSETANFDISTNIGIQHHVPMSIESPSGSINLSEYL
ncbi:uncharacterized protein CMU_026620 [Cryptosporidium muris RN66]|uniref:Uncharacterized protein n=1 Tax=Cryptosporidium muris (strain RN66) TaxID=441375 RepID=B6ABA2_CRYMR|nr:uncharacterized protein CMU_026620 [Cryptosporidium muris RN66]EEA05654.1 hypothetical protein, conserved [Cryptosporidium muris RN66]|eukprot:XP_002140003.1 hypothetical protein [Cryptosporidium muris RN66]